jgi:uncharacterized LabA/DUF88 family protein
MALAINVLTNAFNRNCDVGWLIAGDADYVQLVTEAKRYGCIFNVAAWRKGLSPDLRRASDEFYEVDESLGKGFLHARPELKRLHEAFIAEATAGADKAKARRKPGRCPT